MTHHDLRLFAVIGIIGGLALGFTAGVLILLLPWWLGVAIAGVAGWCAVALVDRFACSYAEWRQWRQACEHDEEAL